MKTQKSGYIDGIGIEIFGVEIYNSTNNQKNETRVEEQTNSSGKVIIAHDKITNMDLLDDFLDNTTYSFFAKVVESKEKYIVVEPVEDSKERKSSDKISIGLESNNDAIYPVGTNVKITYNGIIMETYPAQISAIKIELQHTDNFELIFNGRKDLGVKTIISKDETDNYSYNIYSLGGDIEIKIDDFKYDLRDALLYNKITMEEIIEKANQDYPNAVSYKDGGSMEYHYEDYTILKLHTLDGNRDVYIGVPYMTINNIE